MKIALYITDGLDQIILTPEDDAKNAILGKLERGERGIIVGKGQFYVGREGLVHSAPDGYSPAPDSTYLFLKKAEQP